MTLEEYQEYSIIANKLFAYMNGKINRLNSNCVLYIDMYDLIHNTYANIRYPNNIFLHLGTIIDSYTKEIAQYVEKRDYIGTVMAWAMAHELHHADQLISMLQYNNNPAYKSAIEGDVERASYNWVYNNRADLESIGGFEVIIRSLSSASLPDEKDCNYRKASIKQYYLQTIANIILRDFNLFNKLTVFSSNELDEVDNIVLCFAPAGIGDDVIRNMRTTDAADFISIKENGEYLAENINAFSNLAYKWAGYFDTYTIRASVQCSKLSNDSTLAVVAFEFSNRTINPMIF